MFTLFETSSAVVSECGRYRYRLDRRIDKPGPVVAFFGVNPSTADATAEDATTRKWHGFCERNGWGRYIVGNVFAYRATDVRDLKLASDPIGPENVSHLAEIVRAADILVPCWGSIGKIPRDLQHVVGARVALILGANKPTLTFGVTKTGDPKHPLMLGYDTPIVPFEQARSGEGA